jgi:AcrR family transcriptional regulator
MSSNNVEGAPLSRHERRKRETRARLLEAAAELFGEQGVEATKVVEICARADVAHQTFFNHFPRKGDLLRELFRVGVDMVWTQMDAACERAATTRERLAVFFEDVTRSAAEAGPMSSELTAQIIRSDPEDASRRVSEIFLTLVRRGLAAGDVTRRYEPELLAELVHGALAALMSDWAARPDLDVSQRANQLASLVADALERRPDGG